MSEWAGFSDADLTRMRHDDSSQCKNNVKSNGTSSKTRRGPTGRGTNRGGKRNAVGLQASNMASDTATPVNDNMKLSTAAAPTNEPNVNVSVKTPSDKESTAESPVVSAANVTTSGPVHTTPDLANRSVSDPTNQTLNKEPPAEVKELNEQQYLSKEMSNLEKYRLQQKMIEDQNKKKRAMLTSTIQQRQKRAVAETSRLVRVQKELEKLDNLLSIDVSVIRNKIEEASLEYMEAQKRYEKAEDEYVKSKIHLHNKLEQKEHLTEHLYTIIHQNEIRKAEKLTTLMEQLSVEPTACETPVTPNIQVPQLGIITMANVAEKQYESMSNSSHLAQLEQAAVESALQKDSSEKEVVTGETHENGVTEQTADSLSTKCCEIEITGDTETPQESSNEKVTPQIGNGIEAEAVNGVEATKASEPGNS